MTTVTQVCGFTLICTDKLNVGSGGQLLMVKDGRVVGKIVNIEERVKYRSTSELLNLAARAIRVQPCKK